MVCIWTTRCGLWCAVIWSIITKLQFLLTEKQDSQVSWQWILWLLFITLFQLHRLYSTEYNQKVIMNNEQMRICHGLFQGTISASTHGDWRKLHHIKISRLPDRTQTTFHIQLNSIIPLPFYLINFLFLTHNVTVQKDTEKWGADLSRGLNVFWWWKRGEICPVLKLKLRSLEVTH